MTSTLERPVVDRFIDPEYRVEGGAKVSGRAMYTADIRRPDMLYAAFATSTYPHAKIISIDTSAAEAAPGVKAVITGADIGPKRFGRHLYDWPVLAFEKVRFIGERVAAVAAETRDEAEEAARLIVVEYEELPAVFDGREALMPDAPVIHEDADSYTFSSGKRPPRTHPNLQGGNRFAKGDADLEPLFAAAYRVYEHEYETPRQHHGFIEPHAAVLWIDEGGIVHVHSPNKSPFRLREQLSVVSGLPREKIIVESSYIGGDFGGKGLTMDEFPIYFLALRTKRPVKSVMSYVDELQASGVRHSSKIRLRTGVDADGKFLVHQAEVVYNGGAYAAGKPGAQLTPGNGFGTIGYQVPHARLDVHVAYTNTIPCGHMRSPADVQTMFAWESHVDEIARDLGIDALEIRLRNVMREGDTALTDEPMHEWRGALVLEAIKRESAWGQPLPPGRGRGIAMACRHTGGGKTSLVLRLEHDGTIVFITGLPDQGAGASTVMRRIAAAELDVRPERVLIRHGSTGETLNDPGAGASRVTHIVGRAALGAALALRDRLERETGARIVGDRFVDAQGASEAFETVAARLSREQAIEVRADFDGEHHDAEHPADYSFSAFCIEVEVDRETGAVRVEDVVFAVEVGAIINPVAHQGQLDGGYVYGLGSALMEELPVDAGKVTTLSLGEYKLPTIVDVPPMRTILIPGANGNGPYGAKMAGELSNSAVAPAIANAVRNAVGARVTTFPITSERVYNAMHAASFQGASSASSRAGSAP